MAAPPTGRELGSLGGRLNGALPAVNLVAVVATVAVMWWRLGRLETQVEALTSSVVALKVEFAAYSHRLADPH